MIQKSLEPGKMFKGKPTQTHAVKQHLIHYTAESVWPTYLISLKLRLLSIEADILK